MKYDYFWVLLWIGILLWVLVSYINYKNTLDILEKYMKQENDYRIKETAEVDQYIKYNYYQFRINFQNNYPELYELSIGYRKDKEATKRKLFIEFLKYGFIYNIWK